MSYKLPLLMITAMTALTLSPIASAKNAPTLTIENFVGRIEIITSDGANLDVTRSSSASKTSYEETGHSLTVDGNIRKPDSKGCDGNRAIWSFTRNDESTNDGMWGGYKNLDDFPKLTITAPSNVHLVTRNTILFAKAGNIGSADITESHCGYITLGDIAGDARVTLNGSGDVHAGNAGNVITALSGSGDISFHNVANAEISLRGSGDINIDSSHNTSISLRGSGDVEIDAVDGPLEVSISGSGDVSLGDVNGNVSLTSSGSSDIEIDSMDGALEITSRGSSGIEIGGGNASPVDISVGGSGTVEFSGKAHDVDLSVSGSGDIIVDHATGRIATRISGSGDIEVNGEDMPENRDD